MRPDWVHSHVELINTSQYRALVDKTIPRFFILVGDEDTWKVAFTYDVWGFSEKTKKYWNTVNAGDRLAFYVTAPIKKIIGFGIVEKKFTQEDLIWPDEKFFGRSIWTYRIKFSRLHVLNDYNRGIMLPANMMLNIGRKQIDKNTFLDLLKDAELKWGVSF